jgi:nucleoside-diphosphate kinase
MMEKTLVILKPCTLQRGLVGEITNRFERKGLRLAGMKMVQLTDEVLSEHYAHLSAKPFFQRVKDSMMACPVIVCCFEGVDAIEAVRVLTGPTNGRKAARNHPRRLQYELPGKYRSCIRLTRSG